MGHYLDHSATSTLRDSARAAMIAQFDHTGNPNAVHAAGRAARKVVDDARDQIAAAVNCRASEVIFTAGGTESDNLAIKGLYWSRTAAHPQRRVVATAQTEHHAVLDAVQWLGDTQGAEVVYLPLDAHGVLDLAAARDLLEPLSDQLALVTLMWGNNETGVVHPVHDLAKLTNAWEVPLHIDGTQAVGHVPVDFAELGAQALTISAHKFGGPVGAGALILDTAYDVVPVHHGGGQERRVRSGTLDAALLAGFGAAMREANETLREDAVRLATLRNDAARRIAEQIPDVQVTGPPLDEDNLDEDPAQWTRLPHVLHISFTNTNADSLLFLLDRAGIYVSAGSACTAGVQKGSHVTRAMGLPAERLTGGLRISLGHCTTQGDIDALCAALPQAVEAARI